MLLEAQFLATLAYYVSELRPEVKLANIRALRAPTKDPVSVPGGETGGETGGEIQETQDAAKDAEQENVRDWVYVRTCCFEMDVQTEVSNGGNYVRALRVLREAEMEYGYKDGLYLNTALMIVDQMVGGGGSED